MIKKTILMYAEGLREPRTELSMGEAVMNTICSSIAEDLVEMVQADDPWFDIDERQPPQGEKVIFYTEKGEIHTGYRGNGFYVIGGIFSFDGHIPTHWRHMIDGPK
jgi:hypothetical protein